MALGCLAHPYRCGGANEPSTGPDCELLTNAVKFGRAGVKVPALVVAATTVAPGRRIHDLRHTAACLWLARGVDPVAVQAWLGHASIAIRTPTCTTSDRRRIGPDWTA